MPWLDTLCVCLLSSRALNNAYHESEIGDFESELWIHKPLLAFYAFRFTVRKSMLVAKALAGWIH